MPALPPPATPATADRQERWLQRYLAVRRPVEVLLWLLLAAVQVVANTLVTQMDLARIGVQLAPWEVPTWEITSNLVWLLLIPGVVWVLGRWPLHWGVLRRHLPLHLLAAGVCCVLHVLGMVLLRQLVYLAYGSHYAFDDWPRLLGYEALKDLRSYVLVVAAVLLYRLLLWRWQGEARWLAAAPAAVTPTPEPVPVAEPAAAPPERLLVKKLGKEFLLPVAEIEWVQACGNYVNLHRQQHDYPLRATLAGIERQLDPQRFVRVHRSYLVNLAMVHAIEPTESGDARVRLRDGASVPCSRTHLDALRQRAGGGPQRTTG
ncbi:LytTR family DNA-binding domain-containing protein [Rubrivivax sp. RP6-9]|uniref:LytTR family DNA-binding domain-containing protein n=1 Tax=Rubrivivax sp. RP6-9 TaxID=3415750 RepID=UPI003CC54494